MTERVPYDVDDEREPRRLMTLHTPARVTLDPPSSSLPESVVSVGELGLSYQVLEDWSDD